MSELRFFIHHLRYKNRIIEYTKGKNERKNKENHLILFNIIIAKITKAISNEIHWERTQNTQKIT
jgi:hypothetical protein